MLTDSEKRALARGLKALGEGSTGAWAAIAPLARAAGRGDITIDLSAAETVGVPIIIARPGRTEPDLPLTPRQAEVARLVAEGMSNKDIARALAISVGTVKDHVHAILLALGAASRAGVARRLLSDRD